MDFIEEIAKYAKKYASIYNICVISPIVAQAVLESEKGTSELAKNANNYFGLKYKAGRCPSASGIYNKVGSEQNADGSYTNSAMQWCKFDDMEQCVIGYFDFINNSRYANLKGVTDPEQYLINIRADGYATSLKYVENLLKVIDTYDLTKYDVKEVKKLRINVHAGHNPDNKVACGAIGLIKESTENRKVKDEVIRLLKADGHTVYDCTVDDGTDNTDVLKKIVAKCNAHDVDLDVSIHFNAGAKDANGNGTTTGTEVFIYNDTSKAKPYAQRVVNNIAELGFKNRGVKCRASLYVLRYTKAPAMLIEACFVDDKDDIALYNVQSMAKAIAEGIVGHAIENVTQETTGTQDIIYRVQCGAYRNKANAEALMQKLKAAGFDSIIVKA